MSVLDNIPAELRERPQWVLWKKVTRGDKPTKIPYQISGAPASSTNPSTWTTFNAVVNAAKLYPKMYSGLGYVFAKDDPYVGIDIDNCRNPETGEIQPWAQSLISSLDTYAEVSPSKTGVKLWTKATLPADGKRTAYESGAVEIYQAGRYFAVTGQPIGTTPPSAIAARAEPVARLYTRLFGEDNGKTTTPDLAPAPTAKVWERLAQLPDSISGEQGHDKCFRAACEILRLGLDGDAGRAMLDEYNAAKCDPPWSGKELDHKWKSAQAHVMRGREFGILAPPTPGGNVGGASVTYRLLSCAELDAGSYEFEPIIKGALIAKQNCIIAGPSKTYKTSLAADAGISVATGTRFLGYFPIERPRRVLFMAGEIGESGIQDYARRICKARGLNLAEVENLYWSTDLPKFGERAHLDALAACLFAYEIELLILDPLYMAMPGADAANMMIVGGLLRSIGDLCHDHGCTPLFLHHTVKAAARDGGNLGLHQIAWAGFGEWARQWWLVQPIERWRAGRTTLRVNIGGSTGIGADVAIEIDEGVVTDETPVRQWAVTCKPLEDAEGDAAERAETKKADAERRRLDSDLGRIRSALLENGELLDLSHNAIAKRAGNMNKTRAADLLELLTGAGEVLELPGAGKIKALYRLAPPKEFGTNGTVPI